MSGILTVCAQVYDRVTDVLSGITGVPPYAVATDLGKQVARLGGHLADGLDETPETGAYTPEGKRVLYRGPIVPALADPKLCGRLYTRLRQGYLDAGTLVNHVFDMFASSGQRPSVEDVEDAMMGMLDEAKEMGGDSPVPWDCDPARVTECAPGLAALLNRTDLKFETLQYRLYDHVGEVTGAPDVLGTTDDGWKLVLELKTGQPQTWHGVQVSTYAKIYDAVLMEGLEPGMPAPCIKVLLAYVQDGLRIVDLSGQSMRLADVFYENALPLYRALRSREWETYARSSAGECRALFGKGGAFAGGAA